MREPVVCSDFVHTRDRFHTMTKLSSKSLDVNQFFFDDNHRPGCFPAIARIWAIAKLGNFLQKTYKILKLAARVCCLFITEADFCPTYEL